MQKCQIKKFKNKFHILYTYILTIIVKTQRLFFIVLKKIFRNIDKYAIFYETRPPILKLFICEKEDRYDPYMQQNVIS